jgi:hypothetical protein|tara:strand:- start:793 stop:2004 length:1212 start_codon:yes stop_codon:yes gene_type:complete
MNWLTDVTDSTSKLEPPQSFFYWSAIAALAATVNGNVWLDRYSYLLFPNVFVMLLADSGLRKGIPINLMKRLLRQVKCNRVISGRNSIEAVITTLGKAHSVEGGGIIKTAKGFLISGEFSNFIIKNPDALTVLTDLYDSGYNEEWDNTLKHSGVDKLRNVNLTMLGASNPTHFSEVVSTRDIEGGFIARTFLIHEEEKHTLTSLAYKPEKIPDEDKLLEWLLKLKDVKGVFTWSKEGAKFYDDWYMSYNADTKKRRMKDKTGTSSRFEDHVLKVAMLISLAQRTELVLMKEDIQTAIDVCFQFLIAIDKLMLTSSSGKSALSDQTKLMVSELISVYPDDISRRKILQRNWGDICAMEFDAAMETLVQGGIAVGPDCRGSQMYYKMTKKMYDFYMRAVDKEKEK